MAHTGRLPAACRAGRVEFTAQGEAQPLVESLTGRELEVLNLIAAGLRNKAIAGTLFITVGPAKRHTSHICGKSGVNSRSQAGVRAGEPALIEGRPAKVCRGFGVVGSAEWVERLNSIDFRAGQKYLCCGLWPYRIVIAG